MKLENSTKQINQNRKLFEKALSKAQIALRNGKLNSTIAWAQISADFALNMHPGFYTSMALESLLLEVANRLSDQHKAQDIDKKVQIKYTNTKKKHVLHVMTEAFEFGGHTRLVSAWIKNTSDTTINSVISTVQQTPLPGDLASLIKLSGGKYWSLAEFSPNPLTRSFFLRHISRKWADVVVLHIHPYDAIPIVAFGVAGGPPVIFLNHADHAFWLGASVADVVANLRPSGQKISLSRRGIKNSKILPLPILEAYPKSDYEVVRKQLGIKKDKIVLLTVGDQFKYTPFGGYDFVAVMEKIMRRNPKVVLFAIGPKLDKRWAEASARVGGRIKAMGTLNWSELQVFYDCADIYVEGFPVGGMTAMLEAGLRDIPIIGVRVPEAPILNGSDDVAIETFNLHLPSLEAFSKSLEDMINQPSIRGQKTKEVEQSIDRIHFSPGWNDFLDDILQSLPLEHESKLIDSSNLTKGNSDIFWAGLEAAARENHLKPQFNLDYMLVKHGRYALKSEWIMSILKILLKTNNISKLQSTIYILREIAHGRT